MATKRGRPTAPPPPGVLQIVISTDGITVEDTERGKARVKWCDLKFIRTPQIALNTYRACGFKIVAQRTRRNRTRVYILHKPITERSA